MTVTLLSENLFLLSWATKISFLNDIEKFFQNEKEYFPSEGKFEMWLKNKNIKKEYQSFTEKIKNS